MAEKKQKIIVDGTEITIIRQQDGDYISLSDIARKFGAPKDVISNWLRNRNTLEFLGVWESLYNKDFKGVEFDSFLYQAGSNRFSMSAKKWINGTKAIGIRYKAGRGGGVIAHQDIAMGFLYWLSPPFQVYVVQEFQRLKAEEATRKSLDWNVKRLMVKANYRIHTEAVREHLIPPRIQYTRQEGMFFATEADLLNLALFGMTAKEWRRKNPEAKGNMRDHATAEQLLVLSNLQSLNAKLMEWDCDEAQRLEILNKTAIDQMSILISSASLDPIKSGKRRALKKPEDKKKT